MGDNYDKILEKIAKASGIEKEEVERRVEAKRAKLSGLISRDGALQVIAAELGVNFDNEKFKIEELLPGMRKVHVSGKVVRLFPIREFTTKRGDQGKVLNFVLADDTSSVRVVLWDIHHIAMFETNNLKEGDSVEIMNGSIRDGEIHLGSFSELKKTADIFDVIKEQKKGSDKKIAEFAVNDSIKTRAFVVQSFDPRFFVVCPNCKKKMVQEGNDFVCADHGANPPEKRALLNIIIDDGTETIRAVVFHDHLTLLGFTDLKNPELTAQQRENILGREYIFSGNVRMNKFFNNPEFIIDGVTVVDLDQLLTQLN